MKLSLSKKRGCGYWFRLLLFGLVVGLPAICGTIEVLYVEGATRPAPSPPCCITPGDLGLSYESVTFTSDGIKFAGWYIPSRNRAAVILLHGYGNNRAMMLGQAQLLAQQGYGVLLYDLRGHGESGGTMRAYGWQDANDVNGALDYLQTRADVDQTRIGILGFSIGGQIAIRAAAQNQRLKAVIADDPGFVTGDDAPPPASFTEWPIYAMTWVDCKGIELRTGVTPPPGVVRVIGQIAPRPLLLIATGQDMGYRLIQHYYDLAGEPKTLWQIPETYHGGELSARPQEYAQRVTAFFDQALLSN